MLQRAGRIAVLLASLVLGPSFAAAQQAGNVSRVGVLASRAPTPWIEAFRGTLRQLGWVEGGNLVLDIRHADGQYERLPALAAGLIAVKPDAIFAATAPAIQAATNATTTIPIVIETLGDAVASGLVPSLSLPGSNVTGVSGFAPALSGKRLQLLREILPQVARVALLANLGNPATPAVVRETETAARELQLQLHVVDIRDPDELASAFQRMTKSRAEAVVVVSDPMIFGAARQIIELAARHRLPAASEMRSFAVHGGLLSYGPRELERFQRAAVYVDRVLRGVKPADLPVEQPREFELVINTRTAGALGLTIPRSVLMRTDAVIQ